MAKARLIMFRAWFFVMLFSFISCENIKENKKSTDGNKKQIVILQPLHSFSTKTLLYLKDSIEEFYPVKVIIAPLKEFPVNVYYQPRNRYRADSTIKWLKQIVPDSVRLIVGITDADISTSKGLHKDYGVMGLGYHPGKACVVSTVRIRKSAASAQQLQQRIFKVVVHEMGHNFGLPHCLNQSCIMVDAEGKMKLDDEKGLCADCNRKISFN